MRQGYGRRGRRRPGRRLRREQGVESAEEEGNSGGARELGHVVAGLNEKAVRDSVLLERPAPTVRETSERDRASSCKSGGRW